MDGCVEVMKNDQILGQFSVRALKFKDCLERLRDASIPPPHVTIGVPTDETGRQVQHKSCISTQLKTSMFHKCNDLVLRQFGTEQERQI